MLLEKTVCATFGFLGFWFFMGIFTRGIDPNVTAPWYLYLFASIGAWCIAIFILGYIADHSNDNFQDEVDEQIKNKFKSENKK